MLQAMGMALVLAGSVPAAEFEQSFECVAVADGIVAYIATESPGGVVQGNITVVSGKDPAS